MNAFCLCQMFNNQGEMGMAETIGQIWVREDRKKNTKNIKTCVLGDALARREKRSKKDTFCLVLCSVGALAKGEAQ